MTSETAAIKELEKIQLKEELTEAYDKKYSMKWVERVIFWGLLFIATGVAGIILTNYVINYVHIPKYENTPQS